MDWFESLRLLLGIGVFLVPLAMLVIVGVYIILLPCGFLAGLILKRTEPEKEDHRADEKMRHAHQHHSMPS